MTLLGFALAVVYIPGVTGYVIHSGWLLLSATLPFILRREMLHFNPFLIYATVALSWTMILPQGIFDLWKLFILAGVFVLGHNRIDIPKLLVGMAFGFGVSTIVGLAQWWGWDGIFQVYYLPSGLFANPNVFGEIGALLSIGLLATGRWWLILLTAPAVVLSESRTAILALGVCAAIWLWNRYRLAGPILVLALGLGVTGYLFDKPVANATYRLAIWANAYDGLTFLGRGPGSYMITNPAFSSRTDSMASREEDAHNDFLQIIYQYGIGSLLLLPLIVVGLLGPLGPERYIFIAFCIIAFFNFPLEIPLEAFLGTFCLGRLWADRSLVWFQRTFSRSFIYRGVAVPKSSDGRSRVKNLPVEPVHPNPAGVLRDGVHGPKRDYDWFDPGFLKGRPFRG